jgi:hypothetical protein
MNIAERAQRLCLSPNAEWAVIATEPATLPQLITGYALPLAALSAVGSFVGSLMLELGLGVAMRIAIAGLVMSLVMVAILATVIDAVAPTFGAAKNSTRAAAVAAYAPTPAWVAGLFQLVPIVGGLITFIGAVYALYLLYLGLMRVMKSPADKAVVYTVVVVLIAIVVGWVASVVTAAIGLEPSVRML